MSSSILADLRIRLQPKQSGLCDLWESGLYRRLGDGGSRGGAKSGGVRRISLLRRLRYPQTVGLILRRTLVELQKSHILKLFQEFPQLRQFYNEQKKMLCFPNGSFQFFGSAPTASAMADYYSAEFDDIVVDEAQEFTQDELERLSGSCRSAVNREITPTVVHTFMPGRSESGIPPRGLPYLKRIYIDHDYREEEKRFCGPDGKTWGFVQAFSWDNIEWARKELTADGVGGGDANVQEDIFYSWPEDQRRDYFLNRTEYGATLLGVTDKALREAWLYGKWDVFEGQYFPNFTRERHVRHHAEVIAGLRPWYTYWLSGDWGFDHPHAVYLNAMDEHKRVITFGELWGRKVFESDLGKAITAKCGGHKFTSFVFSFDAGKFSVRSAPKFPRSIIQLMNDSLGSHIPKAHPCNANPGSRIARARLSSQILESDNCIISDECTHLIECLPTLMRDPDNTEDVLAVNFTENGIGDDPYDGWSYGLQWMLGSPAKPDMVKLEETIAGVRQKFVARSEAVKPGQDWFEQFGGEKARNKK